MKKTLLILALCCFTGMVKAQFNYPASKTTDDADIYFGVTYKDPYRWLENIKDPSVEGWFKSQADLTKSVMDNISGRDELIAEWKKLNAVRPVRRGGIIYEAGRYFYRKTMPGEKVGKLYYRNGLHGAEILLFDPLNYIKGTTVTLQDYVPSHDGKMITVAYAKQGAELAVVKVMDIASRKFTTDSIYPSSGVTSWMPDNKSFLYIATSSADVKDPKALLNPKTKQHKLRTESSTDLDFFSNASYPDLHIDPKEYPQAFFDEDNPGYIFAQIGTVANEIKMYYAPIAQVNSGAIQWKPLCMPEDKLVRSLYITHGKVYAVTYNNAKNYKLIATSLTHPDWAHAETVAAEKPNQTLESVTLCKDYLLLDYKDGINSHVAKYSFKTKATTPIKMPETGSIYVGCINNKTNNVEVYVTSWINPGQGYEYDVVANKFSADIFNKPSVFPPAYKNLQMKEVEVKGHDGTMIPLSIIYRTGTKLDGNNACLMDSYGAYGISMESGFNMLEATLAVKGAVIAIPHVRGGSEKGEAWYKGGYKTTKPNTWKDFISCAEYLVANHYTSPGKLSGIGTSAGGILISRAVTERPDLFAAAICNVGCANASRGEFSANGPVNTPEFGTVKDSIECKALYEMDGVAHVVKGTKYPAVICVGGWNDPRVVAWQPGKFAAALQNASTSGKPVLMKVNYDNGHFTEDKDVTFANFADMYAFAMWQCGHPDFKPKKVM